MIVPRITFLGDPSAATPWVGTDKKLARESFFVELLTRCGTA